VYTHVVDGPDFRVGGERLMLLTSSYVVVQEACLSNISWLGEDEVTIHGVLQPAGVSVADVPTMGVPAAGEMRLAGVLPPEGTPTGKISVFSSRFFFGLGSGAAKTR
jgi:hypothetical protein